MSAIENGWYREANAQWDGYSVGLKIEEVLVQEKSKYQDILLFKSSTFGNVLVLDGCIQCTDRDEFCYQEMITHIPMFCHANPQHVLVVGGGDGGVVREVLKHTSVETVTLCEIDQRVIDLSKEHLPNMAKCLGDPRVKIHVGDGVQYMKDHSGMFDVIITDAPDPIGAAKGLYELEYYRCLKKGLRANGIICSQGENLWLDLDIVKALLDSCRQLFPKTGYAYASMPSYAGGHIGFVLASTNPDVVLDQPLRTLSEEKVRGMGLKFYNSDIHKASFVLPQFAKETLYGTKVGKAGDANGEKENGEKENGEKGTKGQLDGEKGTKGQLESS